MQIPRASEGAASAGGRSGSEGVAIPGKGEEHSRHDLHEKAKQHFSCHAQVRDSRRPWVGEEEASFCRALREEGVRLRRDVYFGGEERSLENHFRVLDTVRERKISLEGEE